MCVVPGSMVIGVSPPCNGRIVGFFTIDPFRLRAFLYCKILLGKMKLLQNRVNKRYLSDTI